MQVRSIRRVTDNAFHNAFTGAAWFQGALYIAYRQGDRHVCDQGRLVIQRSRDGGQHFDTVAVIKGTFDTRDAHLYAVNDEQLFIAGFELEPPPTRTRYSGCAWTTNGLNWSPWTRRQGDIDNVVLWRSRHHQGRHYAAGYRFDPEKNQSQTAWYQSADGLTWTRGATLHEGDHCSEAAFWFAADGQVVLLQRREIASRQPVLMRSSPPYETWSKRELPIALHGPMIWQVAGKTYIGGRWYPPNASPVTGIFHLDENDQPQLVTVLPSGPGFDHSYISVAPCPDDPHRLMMAYYSAHGSAATATVPQHALPDVYVVEAMFDTPWLSDWHVSRVQEGRELSAMTLSDPPADEASWMQRAALPGHHPNVPGFVDVTSDIAGKNGVIWFRTTLTADVSQTATLRLGADGPVRAWLNQELVAQGHFTNPAQPDRICQPVHLQSGENHLVIALQTQGGKACGVFARCH